MRKMKTLSLIGITAIAISAIELTFPIVSTGTAEFYDDYSSTGEQSEGDAFYGQDAHYPGITMSYTDNGNGTITDNNTGLMWAESMDEKITYEDAFKKADTSTLGGHDDWRVPTIKELYSLINFTGFTGQSESNCFKYIDTSYFDHPFGDTSIGERYIDAQTWSATQYVGLTMNGDTTIFGVNFIDGRIKGYPKNQPGNASVKKTAYFRLIRGNNEYGINRFKDNGDGTITDSASGLMWQQADDGNARDWEEALAYAEGLNFAGYDDWKLPNAKELQGLVDYTRSPSTTNSAAIDPLFNCTEIDYPDGNSGHFPFYWTSTTHLDGMQLGAAGVYLCFGEALGKMNNNLMDVHGAGAQRSDPKSGDASSYPQYWGPQGDVRYVYNYVRCVRKVDLSTPIKSDINNTANKINISSRIVKNELILSFNLETSQDLSVDLLSANGRKIGTLLQKSMMSGSNSVNIDLTDNLSKGIYFLSIIGENISTLEKLVFQ